MKILCIADHVDPLVYSPQIKQRFGDVDMVLSAGDLPLHYYDFVVSNLNNRKVVREKGLLIGGLGGSLVYNRSENQFSDLGMYLRVLGMLPRLLMNRILHGRYIDILLTHAPPLGINDRPDRCHTGFRAFRWFIRAFRPKILVHGHIHLYDTTEVREQVHEGTRVLNAYDHVLIDLPAPPTNGRVRRPRHSGGTAPR